MHPIRNLIRAYRRSIDFKFYKMMHRFHLAYSLSRDSNVRIPSLESSIKPTYRLGIDTKYFHFEVASHSETGAKRRAMRILSKYLKFVMTYECSVDIAFYLLGEDCKYIKPTNSGDAWINSISCRIQSTAREGFLYVHPSVAAKVAFTLERDTPVIVYESTGSGYWYFVATLYLGMRQYGWVHNHILYK